MSAPLRQAARLHAAQLLVEALEVPAEDVRVTLTDGAVEVEVVVRAARGPAYNRDMAGYRLTGLDRQILAGASHDPQTMSELARHTGPSGHDNDSYFRTRVSALVRGGLLAQDGGTYWLA